MKISELLNNKLIICFKEDRNIFLNLKKKDPFLNFKLMDVNEVIERLSFSYDYKALVEIIHTKKVNIKAARQIINCLRFVDESNDFDDLLALKTSLFNKGLIASKEYQKIILKTSDILLFNQQNNKELHNILKKNNIEFESISPMDLDILPTKNLCLIKYKNRFEQFNNICDEICNLLNDGVNIDEILIRANYNELAFYFNIFEELYNLKFYYKKSINLKIFKSVQKYLEDAFNTKVLTINVDEEDENLKKVFELIKQFNLIYLDFEFGYNLLLEILDTYTETQISKTGIFVTNDFNCTSKKYVFELDFDFDSYPKVFNDDEYYVDTQIESLGMNPSYIKTQIDNDKKKLFLAYTDIKLTICNVKLSSEVFMSTYIEELNIDVKEYIKARINNNSLNASKLSYRLHKNNLKNSKNAADLDNLFDEVKKDIHLYDHTFKSFVDENNKVKRSSYSAMTKYFECPFKYYCEHILKLSKLAASSAIDLGNFTHEVLETVYEKDFDFETRFYEVLNHSENNFTENNKFFFETVIKPYIKMIADFFIYRYKEGNYIKTFSERKETYIVNDVTFVGYIDSILVSEKDGFKYVTVIDYKTGGATFDPNLAEHGLNLQLPIYSLFISEDKFFEDYKIGGLFIQPLFKIDPFTGKCPLTETTVRSALKLYGIWSEDEYYIKSIEKNAPNNAVISNFIHKTKKNVSEVLDMKVLAEKHLNDFTLKVHNFEFEIFPYKLEKSKEIDGCKYCTYRNICYRNGKNIRLIKKEGEAKNEVE
jgi:hypothetical protein